MRPGKKRVTIGWGMWGSPPEIASTLKLVIRFVRDECPGPGEFETEVVEDGDITVSFEPAPTVGALGKALDKAYSLAWRRDPQAEEHMRLADATALIRSSYEAGVLDGAKLAYVATVLPALFPDEPKP